MSAVTRAREAAPIPATSASRPTCLTCSGRLGGAAAAGRRRQFFLAELLLADRRRTMALGRSAPMLTSASPGRGGGDGAGAGRAQRATGSSPTIANSAAPTVVALSLARSALRSCGSERSAEFGSVDHNVCGHARARGGADSSDVGQQTDLLDLLGPAGRRCGCWPTSTVLFSGIVVGRSAADDGARAIGADADVGFAWSGRRRWCRRRSSAASYRVIANDRKFRSTDSGGALPRSLSAAELRLGKISGIWQR